MKKRLIKIFMLITITTAIVSCNIGYTSGNNGESTIIIINSTNNK